MFNFYLKRPISEDLKYICSINSRLFGEGCLSKNESELIFEDIVKNNKGIILTVNHGNRMAGYAYVMEISSLSCGHYAEIVDFNTLEYYRNNGADEYLLKAAEQWAYQMMCREIRFAPDDEAKIKLAERLKYTKDEISQIYRKRL